mgnify:CR=1 FL=1
MSAAGSVFVESANETRAPIAAPARVGMVMTVAIAIATMNTVPIFMALPFKRSVSLVTKGYFRPLTSHERKLVSIIQLIVRNVK